MGRRAQATPQQPPPPPRAPDRGAQSTALKATQGLSRPLRLRAGPGHPGAPLSLGREPHSGAGSKLSGSQVLAPPRVFAPRGRGAPSPALWVLLGGSGPWQPTLHSGPSRLSPGRCGLSQATSRRGRRWAGCLQRSDNKGALPDGVSCHGLRLHRALASLATDPWGLQGAVLRRPTSRITGTGSEDRGVLDSVTHGAGVAAGPPAQQRGSELSGSMRRAHGGERGLWGSAGVSCAGKGSVSSVGKGWKGEGGWLCGGPSGKTHMVVCKKERMAQTEA